MLKSKHSGVILAVIFLAVVGLAMGAYQLYSNYRVDHMEFAEIPPGKVNIIGVDLGRGFRIVVANEIAQLREIRDSDSKKGPDFSEDPSNDSGGGKRSRVPMKELLGSLAGDEAALSKFVMTMNGLDKQEEMPPEQVLWTTGDIQKALSGDKNFAAKLVRDLNMELDGTPLRDLRPKSLENGIVVQIPLPVQVNVGGTQKTLIATVLRPYKPKLMKTIEDQYAKKSGANTQTEVNLYAVEAARIFAGKVSKENVALSLKNMISQGANDSLREDPERVLQSAKVIVNDSMISDASRQTIDTNSGRVFDLTINLTDEGANRLWKYSKGKVGSQLLLVSDNVPIAAPRIQHELSENVLTISQMHDQILVDQAVDLISKHGKKSQ
jgi:hypothetical protein